MFGAPAANAQLSPLASRAEDCQVTEQSFLGRVSPGDLDHQAVPKRGSQCCQPPVPARLWDRGWAGADRDFIDSSQTQSSSGVTARRGGVREDRVSPQRLAAPPKLGSSHRSPSC